MRESDPQAAEQILQEVTDLVVELDPSRARRPTPTLDSSLEKELRLDSLGRAELLLRVGRRFGVSFPERLLSEAETPRDLLRALSGAERRSSPSPGPESRPSLLPITELPERAETLLDVLGFFADRVPERSWVLLYGDEDEPVPLSYGDLRNEAAEVAAGLHELDLEPGRAVALMLPTGREYFQGFWGILTAAGVPVPLYPPVRPSQLEDHLRRQAAILNNARASVLITVPEARPLARILSNLCPELRAVVTLPELRAGGGTVPTPKLRPSDIAFIQYTSGSTGQPKGVVLSHHNLLSNVRTMGRAARATQDDLFVSWLPLYHDMGLIGACLASLYHGFPLVLTSPLAFLARPVRWFELVHQHGGTISAAPNFAYELCLKKIGDDELEGLDLSTWRLALNGAEPVNAGTLRRFAERFAPYGFRERSLFPAYGLAECSVGLAFPTPGEGYRVDRVLREPLHSDRRAVPAEPDEAEASELVGCGRAIPGHEIRIVDEGGRALPERRVGRVQFRGPSATSGYFRHPEANAELFNGEWLDTRDLGYFGEGELFLTGRAKDLIIRAGRNLLPYELEEAVGTLEGVRKGCVAVFGAADPGVGTERLVVLAETRLEPGEPYERLRGSIADLALEVLATPADEVVLAPPGTVLKTSSGKIRRAACRERYERGALGRRPKQLWWQVARLAAAGVGPSIGRGARRAGQLLWGGWAWALFAVGAGALWPLMMLLPGRRRRRATARGVARTVVRLAGVSVRVEGCFPPGPCVVVANHASYADAPLLVAALPSELAWVAKEELAANPLTRIPLDRFGVRFVQRFDAAQGVEDSRRLGELARQGETLAFFPEGTFDRRTGLLPFRLGAFRVAAESELPVVPVVIRGSRRLLRAGRWMPRRGPVDLWIGDPIHPEGTDFAASVSLRDRTRELMLTRTGEPDLAPRGAPD